MKAYTLLALISLSFFSAFSQDENKKTEHSVEEGDSSDYKMGEAYNYLIRAKEEQIQLTKINLLNLGTQPISYERKFKKSPSFSFLIQPEGRVDINYPTAEYYFESIGLRLGIRDYYNINRRIRKGKSANNFSANYISLETFTSYYFKYRQVIPQIAAIYGIQRKISKHGYVDFNFGPGFNMVILKTYPHLSLGLGLAF